jgi:predicted small lipoprotein YifL
MTLRSRALMIVIVLLMAGGLTACGRKGALEPPQNAVTIPGAPMS